MEELLLDNIMDGESLVKDIRALQDYSVISYKIKELSNNM
jgi:hypothetical protein